MDAGDWGKMAGRKTVKWGSTVRPAAAHKAKQLRRVTVADVTVGFDEETTAKGTPWNGSEWIEPGKTIAHKGSEYLAATVDNVQETTYFVDGVQVPREEFMALLTPSQQNSNYTGVVTLKAENVEVVE